MSEKYNWIKIAESINELNFAGSGLVEIMAGDKRICLAQYKEELFAFAATCPHAGGRFADGYIDALGNVACPLHRYKFCLKNGRNVTGEGYYLKHWPVEVREEGVYVGFETKKLFGLL